MLRGKAEAMQSRSQCAICGSPKAGSAEPFDGNMGLSPFARTDPTLPLGRSGPDRYRSRNRSHSESQLTELPCGCRPMLSGEKQCYNPEDTQSVSNRLRILREPIQHWAHWSQSVLCSKSCSCSSSSSSSLSPINPGNSSTLRSRGNRIKQPLQQQHLEQLGQ